MIVYLFAYQQPDGTEGPIGVFSSRKAIDDYLPTLSSEFDADLLVILEEELDTPNVGGRSWEARKGDAEWTETTEGE